MNVHVDQDKCVSAGHCAIAAPGVFDQRDEDGVVVLLNSTPPAEVTADVESAVASCPAQAIRVTP
jgi:ferredoxin